MDRNRHTGRPFKQNCMKSLKATLYLLLFIATTTFFPIATTAQGINKQIDDLILAELKDKNGPGGAFMVAKNGKPIYQKAFGKANIELDVDLGTDFVFQLGSMTKQFTAIAILILEEQGKISTTDALSKYVPDYPNGQNISLHHLLTHTSGIKEMTPKLMVDFFKDEPVDFAPGEKFEYNNSGYVLLGYIIELASGASYQDFIEQQIFKKLSMDHSRYATDRQIVAKRAYGYQKKESGYVNKTAINFSVPYASGALMATLDDLLKWQNGLNHNLLLKSENAKKAFTKYQLNNGESFSYGYGWHLRNIKGTDTREHGGSIFGFKTMAVYIPSADIYVVGLTNCDCNSPTKLVQDIAALVLESTAKK
jgi:CubicO group peptidase (beta-lactamase class C family)